MFDVHGVRREGHIASDYDLVLFGVATVGHRVWAADSDARHETRISRLFFVYLRHPAPPLQQCVSSAV